MQGQFCAMFFFYYFFYKGKLYLKGFLRKEPLNHFLKNEVFNLMNQVWNTDHR